MYGWTFNIEDSTAGVLSNMIKNMSNVTAAGTVLNDIFKDVGNSGKDLANVPPIFVPTKAIDIAPIQIALSEINDFYNTGISEMSEQWDVFRDSAINAVSAIRSGDISGSIQPISDSIKNLFPIMDTFKSTWIDTRASIASNDVLNNVWNGFISHGSMAIKQAQSIGLTLISQTLPNIFTFAGRGALSIGAYVASLMGATSAQFALNTVMLANPIGVTVLGFAAVGAAVYGVIKYWDDLKGYLYDFGAFFIKNSPFSWVYDVVNNLFPSLKSNVIGVFSDIYAWINKYFIEPITNAVNFVKNEISQIWNGEKNAAIVPIMPQNAAIVPIMPQNTAAATLADFKETRSFKKKDSKEAKGLNIGNASTIEGGGNIKNINIRIEKMVDKIEIHNNNVTNRDYSRIKEDVLRALVDATNDFNRQ